jgi:hypothetical protein
MPTSVRMASRDAVELAGPVANEDPELGEAIAEIDDEVVDGLGGSSALGVGGRAQQGYGPVSDLQEDEHGDPREGDRAVQVGEVAGQHGRCRGTQELPPCRIGAPGR